ncbi:AHH domain-containing protein [Bacillus sp. S14(2024)]|uniref:AHH domain-containing protein n=1 Tax=Bacillus sp. S14(2024) TaxID=3162884 RepID=UPI003D1AF815
MSLNMYLGEVRAQSQSMNAMCVATIQGMEQAINSIDAFVFDSVLQGQTYDSAKTFFAQTFRTLAQGIIYLCEELIRQNDAFPNDFQSQVTSTDVIEQEIRDQIRELEQAIAALEAMSEDMPGAQAMLQIYYAMLRKLQEKLEHLYAFNYTSSSNYDTALQLAANVAQGLAQVQGGKGFSPASGTFSVQELNMGWTASIQKITEDKAREVEKLKEENPSEKSNVEKFLSGVWDGAGQAVEDTIDGIVALGDGETWKNMGDAALHPIDTLSTMYNVLSDSFINDVINGDLESGTRWFSYALTQIAIGALGDKGISKVTTLAKGANLSKFSQGMSQVANRLNMGDRLAFADMGELNVRSSFGSTAFNQAEDAMVFAKTGGGTGVKTTQEVIQDYADKVLDRVDVKGEYSSSTSASKVLREELKDAGIQPPPYPNAAHHITPWNDSRAVEAQELLEEFGIHHDSAANGVFLPYKVNEYVTSETLHIGRHSQEYITEVIDALTRVSEFGGTQADAVEALHKIRERLLDGTLKLNKE